MSFHTASRWSQRRLRLAVFASDFGLAEVTGGVAQLLSVRPLDTMKKLPLILLVGLLFGCASRSSPTPTTAQDFQKVHAGMSRQEIYQLLGKPQGVLAQGVRDVYSEVWVAPPDSRGQKVRLSVLFWADGKAHGVDQDILK